MTPIAREPIDVLGHTVRPLTIGQVERLETLMLPPPGAAALSPVRQALEVLRIALSRDSAAVDVEELECDIDSLTGAMTDVLRLGGFVQEAPGKPQGAPAGASTGDGSAAG